MEVLCRNCSLSAMLQFIKSEFGLDFSLAAAEAEVGNFDFEHNRARFDGQNETFSRPTDVEYSMGLAGNPLPLQEICNLTMADADITSETELAPSTLIDYANLKYDMNMLFALDDGGTMAAFGVTEGPSPIERRIIRVRTDHDPDFELKLADLRTMHMPFSEASTLPGARYLALALEFLPYSPVSSPLSSVRVEMERVKRLCLAYRDEAPWTPVGDRVPRSREELSATLLASLSRGTSS
ncbi:unnamed protein product [Schistocephalus solidus]|uniref:Type II toxin-antitoxin system HipA family toxin n=1 Tax=Schistocephalus solidus TaxID=70667 RepID=A0A183T3C9_SCHSO|nr:unnamed protein product [Schistocephalus solidus]